MSDNTLFASGMGDFARLLSRYVHELNDPAGVDPLRGLGQSYRFGDGIRCPSGRADTHPRGLGLAASKEDERLGHA